MKVQHQINRKRTSYYRISTRNPDHSLADQSIVLGDILTILFSFFVLMVTLKEYSLLTTAETGGGAPQFISDSKEASAYQSKNGAQIEQFAFSLSEREVSRFIKTRYLKKNQYKSIITTSNNIVVELCTRSNISNPWRFVAKKLSKIKKGLVLKGIKSERIGLRILGPNCESLHAQALSTSVLSVVSRASPQARIKK
jgi:hypothetical protein